MVAVDVVRVVAAFVVVALVGHIAESMPVVPEAQQHHQAPDVQVIVNVHVIVVVNVDVGGQPKEAEGAAVAE